MIIEIWPISKPIPYARNARKIPQAAIDKVAASIKEFGFRQPIVVDTAGVIIAGHCRLLAAQKLGLTEVPVHVATGLTPAQVKAYRLMDNRSHQDTKWEMELVGVEIAELQHLGIDLGLTGFDPSELTAFISGEASSPNGEDGAAFSELFQILVKCSSEQQQGLLLEQLSREGYECRALIS
jgi:ParB-like chromosome segregation protein Spo0J